MDDFRRYLSDFACKSPAFSILILDPQRLTVEINYTISGGLGDYGTVQLEAFSLIRYRDARCDVAFEAPLSDPDGQIPSRMFLLGGQPILKILMTDTVVAMSTAEASIEFTFNDGPWEAIILREVGREPSFIIGPLTPGLA